MLAVGQTSICFHNIGRRRRTYRSRKKPCMKKVDKLDCAIRHRRCPGCPFDDFFKPVTFDGSISIKSDQEKSSDRQSQ